MALKRLANSWTERLARITGETDRYKIALARYMVESFLSMLLSLFFILIFGLIFGVLKTAILITIAVAVLKSFMGGLHLKTPLRCALVGAVMTILLSYLARILPFHQIPKLVQLWVFVFLVFIVWKQAPLEAQGKPLTIEHKKSLARYSRLLILLITLICWGWPQGFAINELFYGTFFQGLNLTRPLALALATLDHALDRAADKFQGIIRL
ncbi:MAG TPA: accessory gene regulator B family protein [Firmicutes bacterium]|nr:accessory gene regulator B family protein [Bacillota bacterium]